MPLTIDILPDLHLWQVEGCPNDSGAQVAAPPPKSRDGPCSAAVNVGGILMGWAAGMLQVLWTHEGATQETPASVNQPQQDLARTSKSRLVTAVPTAACGSLSLQHLPCTAFSPAI